MNNSMNNNNLVYAVFMPKADTNAELLKPLKIKQKLVNEENKALYEKFMKEHTGNGGQIPEQCALSELVKYAIENKNYKIYYGGGYEHKTKNDIKNYDVVVWFSMAGDPYFMVCMDNSEGDSCDLYRCNSDCKIEKKII